MQLVPRNLIERVLKVFLLVRELINLKYECSQVEVLSPKKKVVNFGALQVGETCTRTVSLANRSLAPVSFLLVAAPNASLPSGILSINPAMEITMKPRGAQLDVQVRFAPNTRVPYFCEEVR